MSLTVPHDWDLVSLTLLFEYGTATLVSASAESDDVTDLFWALIVPAIYDRASCVPAHLDQIENGSDCRAL